MIWTLMKEVYPRKNLPMFGQIWLNGLGEIFTFCFPHITLCKKTTPKTGSILTPGGYFWTHFVDTLKMMLHTKNKNSRFSGLKEKEFSIFHNFDPFGTPLPYKAMEWNDFNISERAYPKEQSDRIWSPLAKGFRRNSY